MDIRCVFVIAIVSSSPAAWAQTRTSWQMHQGEDLVQFAAPSPKNGAEAEYELATIPPAGDAGWTATLDSERIGHSMRSTLCDQMACRAGAQFTYFQTFVDIPVRTHITSLALHVDGIDDGVQVTIYNSQHPGGRVVPRSQVFLGESRAIELMPYARAGERNRLVVTHVDDCCARSELRIADVLLNGNVVGTNFDDDGDGVPAQDDCDDSNPELGLLLYENHFNTPTNWLRSPPQLSANPWHYQDGMLMPTDGGQQALIGEEQTWDHYVVLTTLTSLGSEGCCDHRGPTNRWRAGIVARAALDPDQDEGYHGYRCALGSNATSDGGRPYAGESTGHFLQLGKFLDASEDLLDSECEDGPNPTFDQLDRVDHALMDLAAGDTARLSFLVKDDLLTCTLAVGNRTVVTQARDPGFARGTVGLSTLNMLGQFEYIKVCGLGGAVTTLPGDTVPGGPGGTGSTGSTGSIDRAPIDQSLLTCSASRNAGPSWLLMAFACALAVRRRRTA